MNTTTPQERPAPISLQRSVDNSHMVGGEFSAAPILMLNPAASRDDVIALAASRLEDVQILLETLLEHPAEMPVARIAGLLTGPLEDVAALIGAAKARSRP